MIDNIVANRSSFYWAKLSKDTFTHSFQLQHRNSGKIFWVKIVLRHCQTSSKLSILRHHFRSFCDDFLNSVSMVVYSNAKIKNACSNCWKLNRIGNDQVAILRWKCAIFAGGGFFFDQEYKLIAFTTIKTDSIQTVTLTFITKICNYLVLKPFP